jgi:3-dehydroquinate dehydratase
LKDISDKISYRDVRTKSAWPLEIIELKSDYLQKVFLQSDDYLQKDFLQSEKYLTKRKTQNGSKLAGSACRMIQWLQA